MAEVEKRRRLVLREFTPYRLVVLGRLMSEQLGAAYADEGLTIPEWRVLAVISQAPEVAARDVVRLTPMDKMAVSRAVASLEQKSLIEKRPAEDRRVNMLALTAKGETAFERVSRLALNYERELLDALGSPEAGAFFSSLEKLERAARTSRADEKSPAS